MSVSASLLGLGLTLTGLGVMMVLLSLRRGEERDGVEHRAAGVIFIGPIPIVFGGGGRWAIVGIALLIIFAILVAMAMAQPSLTAW